MSLVTVGHIDCPVCGAEVRVFRRGFLDPITSRPIYAVSLHFRGLDYCPGMGKRVNLTDVRRVES